MAKKPTTKQISVKPTVKPTTKAPAKAPKKAVQVKISVKPVKNPMIGEKAMPMIPGKKPAGKSTQNMMKQVKTAAVKPNKGKK